MKPIHKIKRGKYTLKVYHDDNPESPREWGCLDKMICFHGRYNLGDKHEYTSNDFEGWDDMFNQLTEEYKPAAILQLYLYDHSGISISCQSFVGRAQHAEWDSGRIGFILISTKDFLSNWGKGATEMTPELTEQATNFLKGQVETYDQYLQGDVYGFRLMEKIDGKKEEIDSCWGFYGDDYKTNGILEHLPNDFETQLDEKLVSVS